MRREPLVTKRVRPDHPPVSATLSLVKLLRVVLSVTSAIDLKASVRILREI